MKKEIPGTWELLAEERAPATLQHLTGGTGGIGSTPHDLVTPTGPHDPYDDQDPTKDLTPEPS